MSTDLDALARDIIEGTAHGSLGPVSLSQFEEPYRKIERARGANHLNTHILLLSEHTLVRFSTAPSAILIVGDGGRLQEGDFKVVINPRFEGNINPVTPLSFIKAEARQNGLVLVVLYLILLVLLHLDNEYSTIQIVNQMLVEANALFIGVFVLFTVTQNRELLVSRELIRRGLTHQLMQNDQYIVQIAIVSLLAALLSAASVSGTADSPALLRLPYLGWEFQPRSGSRILTTTSLALLTNCFLSVSRYYLQVFRIALEGRMYQELMGRGTDDAGEHTNSDRDGHSQ